MAKKKSTAKKSTKKNDAVERQVAFSDLKKIKKLITPEHLDTAIQLLKSIEATQSEWIKCFPKTKMKTLVDTWDPDTWNTLDAELKPFVKLHILFKETLKKRIDLSMSCTTPSLYQTYEDHLVKIFPASTDSMKALISRVLRNPYLRKPIGLRGGRIR